MSKKAKILVVDDERQVCTFFRHLLQGKYFVTAATTAQEAMQSIEKDFFDLILLDLKLPDGDGITLLKQFKKRHPLTEVIIMTGYSTVKTAIEAIQLGAFDYLEKPFEEIEPLEEVIKKALNRSVVSFEEGDGYFETGFVVGRNPRMRSLAAIARKIAAKNLPVLIQGETGTGKEVLARYIHRLSKRASSPFIAVNCAALTETLLESELFGHEKGAFTGAGAQRRGVFEIADGGTLLLDELGEASLALQCKLLRVLENGEFRRIGGEKICRADVRIIATTNADLKAEIAQGRFREDLFYRLNTITLQIPPLRERKEDIPLLIEHITRSHLEETQVRFSEESLELLMSYSWPGNVRELINVISQALALRDGPIILPHHLPARLRTKEASVLDVTPVSLEDSGTLKLLFKELLRHFGESCRPEKGCDLPALLEESRTFQNNLARAVIDRILSFTKGDRSAACKLLNISPRQLKYYLKEK